MEQREYGRKSETNRLQRFRSSAFRIDRCASSKRIPPLPTRSLPFPFARNNIYPVSSSSSFWIKITLRNTGREIILLLTVLSSSRYIYSSPLNIFAKNSSCSIFFISIENYPSSIVSECTRRKIPKLIRIILFKYNWTRSLNGRGGIRLFSFFFLRTGE